MASPALVDRAAGVGEDAPGRGRGEARNTPKAKPGRWKWRRDKSKGEEQQRIDNTSANQQFKAYSSNLPGALPGSTLRNVVYYQNRFIVLDTIQPKSDSQTTDVEATTDVQKSLLHTGCGTLRMSERNAIGTGEKSNERRARAPGRADDSLLSHGKRRGMDMDPSSVTMDARAIEIVVSDASDSQRMPSQKHKLWKRVTSVLRDNRMKGRQNMDALIDHPEEYRLLKNVLNGAFVAIGIALFISVFIVIIYTTIVGDPEHVDMRRGIDIDNEEAAKKAAEEAAERLLRQQYLDAMAESAVNTTDSSDIRRRRTSLEVDWESN